MTFAFTPRGRATSPVASGSTFSPYRADIDGLRAVAIVLVVLYHCGVPGFRNGFLGVDIFFAISGFVITAGLLGEIERTDRVDVLRFWVRRGQRLLPAMTLTVLVVLVVGHWRFTALEYPSFLSDVWATTLYRSNFHFAADATGYFDQVDPSPLLHTWSLAVEEQFYLLWPLVFLLGNRMRPGSRSAIQRIVVLLTIGSLALFLASSDHHTTFYSPFTRAWEFGAGALVALLPKSPLRRPSTIGTRLLAAGGIAMTGFALTIAKPAHFPSEMTALPIAGTAALIAACADQRRLVARTLGRPLPVWLGKLSYSWYLWHWPLLVFVARGHPSMSWTLRLLVGGASLIPAWLTYALLENPIRRSTRLRISTGRTAIAVATCVVIAAASISVATTYSNAQLQDPTISALRFAQSDYEPFTDECGSVDPGVVLEGCSYGDLQSRRRLLLLGDSHALHWMPALDQAARELGLRLTLSVLASCPVVDAVYTEETSRCEERRAGVPALIDSLQPDVVILAHSLGYIGSIIEPKASATALTQAQMWETALFDFARSMKARQIPLLVVLDNPRYDDDPLTCIARSRDSHACSLTRDQAEAIVSDSHKAETNALQRAQYGRSINTLPLLCNAQTCPLITDDGVVTLHDTHHLTESYAASLSTAFVIELERALEP